MQCSYFLKYAMYDSFNLSVVPYNTYIHLLFRQHNYVLEATGRLRYYIIIEQSLIQLYIRDDIVFVRKLYSDHAELKVITGLFEAAKSIYPNYNYYSSVK